MTNGDLIRRMTDEELVAGGYIQCPRIYRNCTTGKTCEQCKIEFLKKEADKQ